MVTHDRINSSLPSELIKRLLQQIGYQTYAKIKTEKIPKRIPISLKVLIPMKYNLAVNSRKIKILKHKHIVLHMKQPEHLVNEMNL